MANKKAKFTGFNNINKPFFSFVSNEQVPWRLETVDGNYVADVSWGFIESLQNGTLDSYKPKDNEVEILKKYKSIPQFELDLGDINVQNKKVSYNALKAIESFTLDSYTPSKEEEEALNTFRSLRNIPVYDEAKRKIGSISYDANVAYQNFKLDEYKPKDEGEKNVIANLRKEAVIPLEVEVDGKKKYCGNVTYDDYLSIKSNNVDESTLSESGKAAFSNYSKLPVIPLKVDGKEKPFGNVSLNTLKKMESNDFTYDAIPEGERQAVSDYFGYLDEINPYKEPENGFQAIGHGLAYLGGKIGAGALDFAGDIGDYTLAGASWLGGKFVKGLNLNGISDKLGNQLLDYSDERLNAKTLGDVWSESIETRYRVPDFMREYVGPVAFGFGGLAPSMITEYLTAGASPLGDMALANTAQNIAKGKAFVNTLKSSLKTVKPSEMLFGLGATASATKEGYAQSGDFIKSFNYGILNGLGEMATERLFGGFGGTGVGAGGSTVKSGNRILKIADDATDLINLSNFKYLNKLASTKVGGKVLDIALEGVEEMIMTDLNPWMQRATINPDAKKATWKERGESFLQGVLLSAFSNAVTYPTTKAINKIGETKQKQQYIKTLNEDATKVNEILPNDVAKFEPLKRSATITEIENRANQIQKVKAINVVNQVSDSINAMMKDDNNKFELLKYDSTTEEIKQRQKEIAVFSSGYANVIVSELVKNNPEKFTELISVGDVFKDVNTGNIVTVISRDAKNTTVQIKNGEKVETRVMPNSKALEFFTNGQLAWVNPAKSTKTDSSTPTVTDGVSIGDQFIDKSTGQPLKVIDRTADKTTVSIRTSTGIRVKPMTNAEFDAVMARGQLERVAPAESTPSVADTSEVTAKAEEPIRDINLKRVGRFYEAYGEDALLLAEALDGVETTKAVVNGVETDVLRLPADLAEKAVSAYADEFNLILSDKPTSTEVENATVTDETTTNDETIPAEEENATRGEIAIVVDALNETLFPEAKEKILSIAKENSLKNGIEEFAKRIKIEYEKKGNISRFSQYFTDKGKKVVSAIESTMDTTATDDSSAVISNVVDSISETLTPQAKESMQDGDYNSMAKSLMEVYKDKGSLEDFADFFVDGGKKVESVLKGETDNSVEVLKNESVTNESVQKENIPAETESADTKEESNSINYSIREDFYEEFDEWLDNGGKDTNVKFVIGNTSDVLRAVGVKNQEIKLNSGTVIQKINAHKEMTSELFKKIPELLENPIIVQFSDAIDKSTQKQKYESRITVLGELYAEVYEEEKNQQKPVLVSLELLPTNQKGTVVLDFSIITSAYAKDALQNYLYENTILYIDPNKKRTNKWLSLNRLQLPLGETKYGPVRMITYVGNKVKVQNSVNKSSMQTALENAGVIDEYGNPTSNSDVHYSLNEEELGDAINQSMTMEQAKDMIQRAFVIGDIKEWFDGEYKNGDEWLRGEGADAVALVVENEWTLQQKFLDKVQGLIDEEFYVADIIEAYEKGTLTGKAKQNVVKRLDTSKTSNATDTRVFAPKDIKNAQEIYKVALERVTNSNREKVYQARADIIMFAHNRGAAEALGLTQSELNKKLATWARYTTRAKDVSMRINKDVSLFNKWTGIENSTILNRASVSDEELNNLVNDIKGDSNGWQRSYIMRTMLALDTHIDYSELNFEFVGTPKTTFGKSVNGLYDNSHRKITVKYNAPHTVAHEMGHFLDYLWARDFGCGGALTDGLGRDKVTDADVKQFLTNFDEFIEQIENVADIRSEYTMDRKEVFARFVAKFVQWVDLVANGKQSYAQEYSSYNDKFSASQYVEFVRLLQEKSMLDSARFEKMGSNLGNAEIKTTSNKISTNSSDLHYSLADDSSNGLETQKKIEKIAKEINTHDELIEVAKKNTQEFVDKIKENKSLQKRLDNAKRQTSLSPKPIINVAQVGKVTKDILKEMDSTLKATDLKDEIISIYTEYFDNMKKASGVESKVQEANDNMMKRFANLAIDIAESAEAYAESEEYLSLKAYLKDVRIKVPDHAKGEAHFGEFRKSHMGTFNLTNDGLDIDTVYQELCEMFPGMFDVEVANAVDQLYAIADKVEALKPYAYNPHLEYMADAVDYIVYRFASEVDGIAATPKTKAQKIAEKGAYDKEMALEKERASFERKLDRHKKNSEKTIQALQKKIGDSEYVRYWEKRLSKEEKAQAVNKVREKQKVAVLKTKIRNLVSDMKKKLDKTEKNGGYPKELVKAVADVCSVIDFHTDRTSEDGGPTKASLKLDALKMQYDALKNSPNYDFQTEYSDEISNRILKLHQKIENKRVVDLTFDELSQLKEILGEINHSLATASKQIGKANTKANFEIATDIIDDLKSNNKAISEFKNSLLREMKLAKEKGKAFTINPHRIFEMLSNYDKNSALWQLYDQINRGARASKKFTMDATLPFDELTNGGGNEIAFYEFRTKLHKTGIKFEDGTEVEIPKSIICEIVMLWDRKQGRTHLEAGGFKIPDLKLFNKGKTAESLAVGKKTNAITQADITRLKGMLDSYDKAWIERSRYLFNNVAKDAINEISMQLLGREIAKADNYIRIYVDSDFVNKDIGKNENDITIEGHGSLKETTPDAKNPVVLRGLHENVFEHIDFSARYYGLAIPIRNFNKVYKISIKDGDSSQSIRSMLGSTFGPKIRDGVVVQVIKDLQSPRPREISMFNKVRGKWLTAVFWGNIKSTLKQTTSYWTSSSILDESSLIKGLGSYIAHRKQTKAEIAKYSGTLYNRSQGLSTTELGDRANRKRLAGLSSKTTKFINKKLPVLRKVPEWIRPGNWLQSMDCATSSALWDACKHQVSKTMNASEDGYMKAVADLYERVIEETQSNYDMLHRPEILKSTNPVNQTLGMFQNDNLQQTGIMYGAFNNLRAKQKAYKADKSSVNEQNLKDAKKRMDKAIRSRIYSSMWLVLVSTLGDALLRKFKPYIDDEDKEITSSSVLEQAMLNMAEDTFGVFVPVYGQLVTKAIDTFNEGYDFLNDPSFDVMEDFIKATSKIWDAYAEDGDVLKALVDAVPAISNMTGIPAKNISDLYKSVKGYIGDIKVGEFAHDLEDYTSGNKSFYNYGDLASYIVSGNTEKETKWNEYYSANGKEFAKGSLTKEIKPAYVQMYLDSPEKANGLKKKLVLDYDYAEADIDGWLMDEYLKHIVPGKKFADKTVSNPEYAAEIKDVLSKENKWNATWVFKAIRSYYKAVYKDGDEKETKALREALLDDGVVTKANLDVWENQADNEIKKQEKKLDAEKEKYKD